MKIASPQRVASSSESRIEAAAADVPRDQFLQPRLEERDLAPLERFDLRAVHVDAEHLVSEVGQARSGDQPHVSRPDDRDAHALLPTSRLRPARVRARRVEIGQRLAPWRMAGVHPVAARSFAGSPTR